MVMCSFLSLLPEGPIRLFHEAILTASTRGQFSALDPACWLLVSASALSVMHHEPDIKEGSQLKVDVPSLAMPSEKATVIKLEPLLSYSVTRPLPS